MSSPASELNQFYDPARGEMKEVLIRAGAGAGKTTELVRRVISLALLQFEKKQEWPKLVVTTFTRKATQELRERLLKAGLKIGHPGLLQYLQSSQSLHISTIHGILTSYLKRYGREIGLAPDFQIMDSVQAQRLSRRVLKSLLKESPQFLEDFQVLREEVDLQVLEQSSLSFWALQLEEGKIDRVTRDRFKAEWQKREKETLQSTQEVVEILGSLTLTESWQNWLGLFQSVLNPQIPFRARIENFNDLASGAFRKTKEVSADVAELARELRKKIEDLGGYSWKETYWEKHEELTVRFERLALAWAGRLRDEKVRQSRLTMEDLELFSLWLTQQSIESAQNFSSEWDYWLIDEYQDTSPRQVKLIQALTQKKNVFRVGDPQQSIYLFRGARAEVFGEAETDVEKKNGELLKLMTNYRTSTSVLEFMNEVFVSVSGQFESMVPFKPDIQIPFPAITLWQMPEEKKSKGMQIEATAQRIFELLQKGVPAEEICVLARKRKDLSSIARLAHEFGLPCQLHAAGEFYERREVLDALSFLKFLVTPEDNENLVSLLRSPWFSLSDQQILQICHRGSRSFWIQLKQLKSDSDFLPTIELLEESLVKTHREGIARVWRDLLISQKVFDFALQMDPSGRREANLWKLVQNLFAQEQKPGFKYTDFLNQPEALSTEETGSGDASPVIEPKRVQLMTVHAAKGLQFSHVIVPFLNDHSVDKERHFFAWSEAEKIWGLCLREPETQSMQGPWLCEEAFELQKERGLAELDRLYYVALTRAQQSLSLIWGEPIKGPWAEKLGRVLETAQGAGSVIHARTEAPVRVSLTTTLPDLQKIREKWQQPDLQDRLREQISVTQVLAAATEFKVSTSSAQTWEKIRRSVRGTEVHRLLESLKYDPQQKLARPEFQEALNFLETGKGKFLKKVIQDGEVEWGFAVRLQKRLLQGQIDLWGRDEEGRTWVIDYKTGSPEHSDKALLQLGIYTWALKKLGRIPMDEKVYLAAVFPFHDQLIQKEALSQNELEKSLIERLNSL